MKRSDTRRLERRHSRSADSHSKCVAAQCPAQKKLFSKLNLHHTGTGCQSTDACRYNPRSLAVEVMLQLQVKLKLNRQNCRPIKLQLSFEMFEAVVEIIFCKMEFCCYYENHITTKLLMCMLRSIDIISSYTDRVPIIGLLKRLSKRNR